MKILLLEALSARYYNEKHFGSFLKTAGSLMGVCQRGKVLQRTSENLSMVLMALVSSLGADVSEVNNK